MFFDDIDLSLDLDSGEKDRPSDNGPITVPGAALRRALQRAKGALPMMSSGVAPGLRAAEGGAGRVKLKATINVAATGFL